MKILKARNKSIADLMSIQTATGTVQSVILALQLRQPFAAQTAFDQAGRGGLRTLVVSFTVSRPK